MKACLVAGAVMMAVAGPAVAEPTQGAAVEVLIDRFDAARAAFDPKALADTLAADYVEISPVGTVDPRAAVLAFYQPSRRQTPPPITGDERVVRVSGAVAIASERKTIALPNGMIRAMRVGYVARRSGSRWQLVSAQYTPIPPAR